MQDKEHHLILKAELHHRHQIARKRSEAIHFIVQAKGDLEQVREEIRKISNNLVENSNAPLLEEFEQVYLQRLKEGLEYLTSELDKRGCYSEQITGGLLKQAVPDNALADAIQLIFSLEFRTDLIDREIKESENYINNPPEFLQSAMLPGSSPGIYRRSYLSALREARKLLRDIVGYKN